MWPPQVPTAKHIFFGNFCAYIITVQLIHASSPRCRNRLILEKYVSSTQREPILYELFFRFRSQLFKRRPCVSCITDGVPKGYCRYATNVFGIAGAPLLQCGTGSRCAKAHPAGVGTPGVIRLLVALPGPVLGAPAAHPEQHQMYRISMRTTTAFFNRSRTPAPGSLCSRARWCPRTPACKTPCRSPTFR
jgi:hypothetical protein